MNETPEDAALEAAKEKFFAGLAEPPDNVAVTIAKASAEADAADPKDAVAPAKSTRETPASKTGVPAKSAKTADGASSAGGDVAARVLDALREGDLDAVAELTGADPADFDEGSTRWAARNRREHGLRKELERVETEARTVLQQFGPVSQHLETFDRTRDYGAIRQLVEYATGEPWAAAAPKLGVAAGAPATPARRDAAADRALLEAIRDDVPDDHQVRTLPGWEDRVATVLREHLDERTGDPSISFKQAAARAVRRAKDEHARLAPVFGGATPPAPGARGRTPERADPPEPAARRRLTRDEWLARFSG